MAVQRYLLFVMILSVIAMLMVDVAEPLAMAKTKINLRHVKQGEGAANMAYLNRVKRNPNEGRRLSRAVGKGKARNLAKATL